MLLISQEDIKRVRPLAEIPHGRIDVYIREAQEYDFKPILGNAFYNDFKKNYNNTLSSNYQSYQDLINGKEYIYNGDLVEWQGIKDMLSYFTLGRFIVGQPANITRFGVVQKTNENSQPIGVEQTRLQSSEMRSIALSIKSDLVQYLEENNNIYPLYECSESSQKATGFNFFSA